MNKDKRKETSHPVKKSVSECAQELVKKGDQKINPIELQQAIHKGNKEESSFENQIYQCLERGIKFYRAKKDFYLIVLFKKERHPKLKGVVVRQMFTHRLSCPTPSWDQVVYKYYCKDDRIEFLWAVPDKESCMNLPLFDNFLPDEQKALIQYAKDFNNGVLDKRCALLNGELVA